jgi:hypothetical protein
LGPSVAFGVGHAAIAWAVCAKLLHLLSRARRFSAYSCGFCILEQLSSCVVGVGQPNKPEALSDVRRADARSAQISSPEGVARCFHVSVYKVEPAEAVLACNLLAKDD